MTSSVVSIESRCYRRRVYEGVGGEGYYRFPVDPIELLGLDTLLAQIILGLGVAMLAGNAFAVFQHRRGRAPSGAGEFRAGRAYWLMAVGVVITIWGAASLLA